MELQRDLGLGFIFISHNLGIVRHISDKVIVMKEGKVVESGKTDAIFNWPKDEYTKKRSSEWGNNSSDSIRLDVLALAQDDIIQLQNFDKVNKIFSDKVKEFEYVFNEYELNPSIGTYDAAFVLQNEVLADQVRLQELQNKLIAQDLDDRIEYIPLAISDFSKNYDRLEQLSTAFKTTGATVSYGLAVLSQIAGDRAYFLRSSATNSRILNEKTGLVDLVSDLNKETESYQATGEVDKIRSLSDASRWGAGTSMNLIPSLAMATTGPAALPLSKFEPMATVFPSPERDI
jgi:hypothetical protein